MTDAQDTRWLDVWLRFLYTFALSDHHIAQLTALEQRLNALANTITELKSEIAEAREACPIVRRQDFFDASLLTVVSETVNQLFQMQSRAEAAEQRLALLGEPEMPAQTEDLLDSLHAVFMRHGIASRSDYPQRLIGDLVSWAAQKCREATKVTK